jgi:hypothetical protein
LRDIIRPAVQAKGYTALRADEISEPGIITNQVIQHVFDDPLVIADLTEQNPNVFYELAVRHVFGRPLIQIIRSDEGIPFDVAATRTVFVDHCDSDGVNKAREEIVNQIDALESDSRALESPISVALDVRRLRRRENPGMSALDPSQVRNLVYATVTGDEYIETMPILLSCMRQDLPWVYDLGMEGHSLFTVGNVADGCKVFSRLLELIDLTAGSINVEPEVHRLVMELLEVLRSVIKRR